MPLLQQAAALLLLLGLLLPPFLPALLCIGNTNNK